MFKKSFLFNLMVITLISVGLLLLFFNSLDWLTNHGKQTLVPSLLGKKMNVAIKDLKDKGFKITIDSTYQSYKNPLEVLFQEPDAGSSVKLGRTIFLTVNRQIPPSIPMPELVNMSFRNALLTMHSYNLEMGDTNYRPDVAAGAVLEQWVKGKQISAGTPVPFGTRIDLVIGEGLSTKMDVPNLIGMRWEVARPLIDSLSLNANPLWEGKITDSDAAIIYAQQPEAINELDFRNSINEGDIMDLRIMQNPSQELINKNQPGSGQLIGSDGVDSNGDLKRPITPVSSSPKHETKEKTKLIPGMNVHTLPSIDPKHSKNNSQGNTKESGSNVNQSGKPKPKPKPKKDNEPAPVKKSDNNISDEFN